MGKSDMREGGHGGYVLRGASKQERRCRFGEEQVPNEQNASRTRYALDASASQVGGTSYKTMRKGDPEAETH